jgi:hypothetical protein
MNARERFLETMRGGKPDRAPLFDEGFRDDVIEKWQSQGLTDRDQLRDMFHFDQREEISLELRTNCDLRTIARKTNGLDLFHDYLRNKEEVCMPSGWKDHVDRWRKRDHVLMLMVHWGFFQTIGVEDWNTFADHMYLLADYPEFVRSIMGIHGEFASKLTEVILNEVEIDAVIFSEPIGGNHGSLISPKMYREIGMPSYYPILEVLQRYGVDILIWRTYANTRVLLPVALESGINCLWACESNPQAMDYKEIREEFGSGLGLIAGIDLDLLRRNKDSIRDEFENIVPGLNEQGRYAPLADGRVRADIPYDNYLYYRQLLEGHVLSRRNRIST